MHHVLRTMCITFVACSALTTSAHASFQFVEVVFVGSVKTPVGPRDVYRLYVRFSEPADRLVHWGAAGNFTTTLSTGPCVQGAFFQSPEGGNTAPSRQQIDAEPSAEWDTFATIGVSRYEQGVPSDQTILSPGFPQFINGNMLVMNNALVSAPIDSPQGRADFAGDGDPALRVLMMQLTMQSGDYPMGSIGVIQWRNSAGQLFTNNNVQWVGLEGIGRCCTPQGTCITIYHSYCVQFYNGAYLGCGSCDGCKNTCVPDIAPHPGDGEVNVDDLLAVISSWGPCVPLNVCPADVEPAPYGNDVINVDDLLAVITAWGRCQ